MWEFLGEVLRTQGLLALVLLLTIGGLAFAVKHLWARNQELSAELHAETRLFAERIDALHEKRAQEMQGIVRESVGHIAATTNAVERINESMSTLRDVIRRDS